MYVLVSTLGWCLNVSSQRICIWWRFIVNKFILFIWDRAGNKNHFFYWRVETTFCAHARFARSISLCEFPLKWIQNVGQVIRGKMMQRLKLWRKKWWAAFYGIGTHSGQSSSTRTNLVPQHGPVECWLIWCVVTVTEILREIQKIISNHSSQV